MHGWWAQDSYTYELTGVVVVIDAVERRNLDLSIRTGDEVHVLACRKLHLELLDERSDVLIADDCAFILLHAKDRLVDMYLQVALHLALASQTPVVLDLLTSEMGLL